MNGCPPIIAVFFPTKGSALAAAALARCFEISPQIVLASELREEDITKGTRVIFLDYLVAIANSSPVKEILEFAKNLVQWGAEVFAYRPQKEGAKKAPTGFERVLDQAIYDEASPRLYGYETVVAEVTWSEKSLDEVSRQLSEDGTRFDMEGIPCGVLARERFVNFDESPEGFRSFVGDVITTSNSLLQ